MMIRSFVRWIGKLIGPRLKKTLIHLYETVLNTRQKSFIIRLRDAYLGYPANHTIEISGICNAKCRFCPTAAHPPQKPYFMETELFENILVHQKKYGFLETGQVISLYNYGEPFIHPDINTLLSIMERYHFKARFSSNFIKSPAIEPGYFPVIDSVVFSLCGISPETYNPVYGTDIGNVMRHFESFLEQKDKYHPSLPVSINWLKYRFNESELDMAKNYFTKLNCRFIPITAYVNDIGQMIRLYELKQQPDAIIPGIEQLIDVPKLVRKMEFLQHEYCDFFCPQWTTIIIDERGHLVGCCEMSRYNEDYDLGPILAMNRKEMYRKKTHLMICKKCVDYGIAQLAHFGYFYDDRTFEKIIPE